jgi:hypothetical protein
MPPQDLGQLVEELQGPTKGLIETDGLTVWIPSPDFPRGLVPVDGSALKTAAQRVKVPPNTKIKLELAYFADAYAALRNGRYDVAAQRFSAMADYYPIETYPLAYFAYAAAKSGDRDHLEKYLDTLQGRSHPTFDYWLARAFFAGVRKDATTAYVALQKARRTRPGSDYRPVLTDYQYAEACDWLYQEMHDARFSAELLAWVRVMEITQPTQGWPYALEYSYSQPGAARVRVLAMAHYLDPKSKRISGASAEELEAARAWFQDNNPFRTSPFAPKAVHSGISSEVMPARRVVYR